MPTLAKLLWKLRELNINPDEIDIPYRWYRRLLDYAEELADGEEADDDNEF